MYYPMSEWSLKGFEPSRTAGKKYDAIIAKKGDPAVTRRVPFGAIGYQQYHDKIGKYKKDDHGDPVRRASYQARHRHELREGSYSPGWFSWHKLW